MVLKIADNIVSPLGEGSELNYRLIKSGKSSLARRSFPLLPEKFYASLFNESPVKENLTRFESLVFKSVKGALSNVDFDISGNDVLFVLGTTKANVGLLSPDSKENNILYPGECAKKIATLLGITTSPIVVCNACISGLSSIVLASRMLEAGFYKYAIVCGADILTEFIISGFQSLKTLSEDECRPFDIERIGMNLGEAAATVILSSKEGEGWKISGGTVRNDAYNITAPSKNGDGAYLALKEAIAEGSIEKLALVNAHGTATLFMDEMESVALERAGLGKIPVNSLKGYFGHTLGAAGVMETILTMQALEDGTILKTRGFDEIGVSAEIDVCKENKETDKQSFIKLVSGFGGANAAIFASKESTHKNPNRKPDKEELIKSHRVQITPSGVTVDGQKSLSSDECTGSCKEMLTKIYKSRIGDYPQYYKMDMLSRLGFIASELLLDVENTGPQESDSTAVILFNHSSSLQTDLRYLQTISDPENFFPSPALFVYTLPNIVTGEIAIRNKFNGETSFYIVEKRDDALMEKVQKASFLDRKTKRMISGWLDYTNENEFVADLYIIEKR
ncbi:MAG: 3-oxoacyl-ACP synthase [Bacteroidales bacterium]|nr:3-oxoacyl-ACP synthase [Bacteroidales bacterium]